MPPQQKKLVAEGKIIKVEYEDPDRVTIDLKTKDQKILHIIYRAHHSFFTQYGKRLHAGTEIKTLYHETQGGGAHVGLTPIEVKPT